MVINTWKVSEGAHREHLMDKKFRDLFYYNV